MLIQRLFRRQRLLHAWHELVYCTLTLANSSALRIQCRVRIFLSHRLTKHLRVEYADVHFIFEHDFAESEEKNWAAFGLLPGVAVVSGDSQHERKNVTVSMMLDVSKTPSLVDLSPALGLLQVLQLPEAPPGCLLNRICDGSKVIAALPSETTAAATIMPENELLMATITCLESRRNSQLNGPLADPLSHYAAYSGMVHSATTSVVEGLGMDLEAIHKDYQRDVSKYQSCLQRRPGLYRSIADFSV